MRRHRTAFSGFIWTLGKLYIDEPGAGAPRRYCRDEGIQEPQGPPARHKGAPLSLKWRRIVAGARRVVKPALNTWADLHSRTQPGTIDVLIEESMEGAAAFAAHRCCARRCCIRPP